MVVKKSEDASSNPTSKVIDWATSQSFNNLLLSAILISIGWIGWFGITTAIPKHLEQIQKGYEKVIENHREERGLTIEYYDKWIEKLTTKNGP